MSVEEKKNEIEIAHTEGGGSKAPHAIAAAMEAQTKYADLGADWLAKYTGPEIEITDEESTRIRWKIDRNVMPL